MDALTIAKYQHACFVATKAGKSVVVDPGIWSDDFVVPNGVVAIVVTHEHPDHCDTQKLAAIIGNNPEAIVYGHESVVTKLTGLPAQAVTPGEVVTLGGLSLQFFGGEHARIDSTLPAIANLGVVINDELYYPGDSFTIPDVAIKTLALPIAAPWAKFSETADFLRAIKPVSVFPTHDAILSDHGKQLLDSMFLAIANQVGATYNRL
jgi:L-ascorbate metabolism protein UlaG (beta-lactamase superfamily)